MKRTAVEYLTGMTWACQPDFLNKIVSIAERTHEIPDGGVHNRALDTLGGKHYGDFLIAETFGNVGVIRIIGPIFRYGNMFTEISGATTIGSVAKVFQTMQEDESIAQIILCMDSPGGEVTGISEFSDRVSKSQKPVTAYVDGMAASAAYWIASAADRIVMTNTASVGSIGVVISVSKSEDDGTIEFVSSQSPYKRLDYESAEGKTEIQTQADAIASIFVETVAENRSTSTEDVLTNFGKGGMKIGRDAVSVGMADEIGTFEDLIKGEKSMTVEKSLTLEGLKADHLEIYNACLEQGRQIEIARVQSIGAIECVGHDKLIATLMGDGVSTELTAMKAILAAEKQNKADAAQGLIDDFPKDVPQQFGEELGTSESKTGEDLYKSEWDTNKDNIKSEFNKFSTYASYRHAVDSGLVKIKK